MKNFVQEGEVLNYTVPNATSITSGDIVVVGDLVGVAAKSGEAEDKIAVNLEGVFELPKVAGALTQGQKVYVVNGEITADDDNGGNVFAGWAFEAAENAAETALVKLKQS